MKHRKTRRYFAEFMSGLNNKITPKLRPRRPGEATPEDLVRYFVKRLAMLRGVT